MVTGLPQKRWVIVTENRSRDDTPNPHCGK